MHDHCNENEEILENCIMKSWSNLAKQMVKSRKCSHISDPTTIKLQKNERTTKDWIYISMVLRLKMYD